VLFGRLELKQNFGAQTSMLQFDDWKPLSPPVSSMLTERYWAVVVQLHCQENISVTFDGVDWTAA
jgi:hypothetical protein